jgi:hypothetical protein
VTHVRRTEKLAAAARRLGLWLRRPQALPEKALYALGLRSSAGLRLPDFLGIGAQKAGTTWLHQNLARHPDVYFPPGRKEIRFFDARFTLSVREYAALFAPAGARRTGDITPNYGALRSGRIRFIQRLMPHARLLLILRNPIERAWSHAVMDLASSRGRPLSEVPAWELEAHFRSSGSLRNGQYGAMLDRWLAVFPREQLLVAFFEEIAEHPRELLLRVFEHLGLRRDVDLEGFPWRERIHGGPLQEIPAAQRALLEGLYRAEIRALAVRLGGPARSWH